MLTDAENATDWVRLRVNAIEMNVEDAEHNVRLVIFVFFGCRVVQTFSVISERCRGSIHAIRNDLHKLDNTTIKLSNGSIRGLYHLP